MQGILVEQSKNCDCAGWQIHERTLEKERAGDNGGAGGGAMWLSKRAEDDLHLMPPPLAGRMADPQRPHPCSRSFTGLLRWHKDTENF